MIKDIPLLNFSKTLAGTYSNKDQSQENPKIYAHINIYYIPLYWSIFKGPWFYSEQSYDHAPWNPYKQAIHQLIHHQNIYTIENYSLSSPERIAGSGLNPELLRGIKNQNILRRKGCSMHFKEITKQHYKGHIEPGNKCLIERGEKITYLKSTVEFNETTWISLDEGIDTCTQRKVWGSEHGALRFKKVKHVDMNIFETWEQPMN